jgi:hypothetical protein
LDVLPPVIESYTLYVDVYFDDDDSIVELKFDPDTDYQDDLIYMLMDTQKRNKI